MTTPRSTLTPRRIAEFCNLRLAPVLVPMAVESLCQCLVSLLERNEYPSYRGSRLDIRALADLSADPRDQIGAAAQLVLIGNLAT